jgi:hypothetical protein
VLKAAWHWGRDCSFLNDPLGEPGRTSLYLGLPSTWGSMDGDLIFFPFFRGRAPYWGPQQIYMNELTIGPGDEALSMGTLMGDMGGGHLPGALRERCRKFWRSVSLASGGRWGTCGVVD